MVVELKSYRLIRGMGTHANPAGVCMAYYLWSREISYVSIQLSRMAHWLKSEFYSHLGFGIFSVISPMKAAERASVSK